MVPNRDAMAPQLTTSGSGFGDTFNSRREELSEFVSQSAEWFKAQPLWKQAALLVFAVISGAIGVLALIYHNAVLTAAAELSGKWKETTGGSFLMFVLVFCVSFPPLIGYSALSTLTGMIWGFPNGWPLLASASILGSLCSFLLFRHVLKSRAKQLMETSKAFEAFTLVLNDENALWLLALIRLCPLPYSLSNGALAAIPGIRTPTFIFASVITSPKLLIPIFIGSKLHNIGESKSVADRIIDILSIAITVSAFSAATALIYRKMQEKMQAIDAGLNVSLDDDGNFEIDQDLDNFLRDDDYEDDNLVV